MSKLDEGSIGEEWLNNLLIEDFKSSEYVDIMNFARNCRIRGLLIVYNEADIGPYLRYYYYDDRSYIAKKYAFDPAALTELLILSKHTKIIKGVLKNRGIVVEFNLKDKFGRTTKGYVLIEIDGKGSLKKAEELANKICELIEKNDSKALKSRIEGVFREYCEG